MPFMPISEFENKPQEPMLPGDTPAGFIPIEAFEATEPDPGDSPSLLKTVALNNPVSAIGETAANLSSQMVALPAAGLAGLATEAGRALGATEKKGADVVHSVGEALTYQPRGEMGKQLTDLATYPFQKLHEAAEWAGGKTLEATDSPMAATAAHTAIEGMLPLAIGPAAKGAKALKERASAPKTETVETSIPPVEPSLDPSAGPMSRGAIAAREVLPKETVAVSETATASIAPDLLRVSEDTARSGEVLDRSEPAASRPGRDGSVTDTLDPAADMTTITPLAARIDEAAHQAATSPLNDKPIPTPAQIEAGTYAKGHVKLHGLDIAIENPKGSIRSGIDSNGRPWQTEMQHHYGYIKRSLAKDGEGIDVFIGERPESAWAFVVDQIDPRTGKYDEPKVILGAVNEADARRIYQANYEPGWKGLGAITPMKRDVFKGWLETGDTTRPAGLPRILDKAVTEYSMSVLARLAAAQSVPQATRTKALAEIHRRGAQADFSGGPPVRSRIGESETQHMAADTQNAWAPGANYAGLIDDARAPASNVGTVAELPAPIRRERIIKDLADALGTHVYEGRVKGKKRMGFFRRGKEEVRTRRTNDIEVVAHEIAHLVDSRVPAIAEAWRTDKALREELKSVSYDRKSVTEGFAESMRLYLTQPDTLQARAPKSHAWLESFVHGHEYGPALRRAQADMTAWFSQDAINRARSKIGRDVALSEHLDGFWDKFRQSVSDDLHGIYKMERELAGKVSPLGAYETSRLTRAASSITEGAVRFGRPVRRADGSFAFDGKGLEKILEPVANRLDDALLYFVGRSARELMNQGREHLFTKAEIDAMLKLKDKDFEQAFIEYQAWNRGILDFAEAHGIINPEARRMWQRNAYLPFHRVGQAEGFKGKPGDWSGVKALTGGTENIRDVLGNIVGNAAMLMEKAIHNEARLKIADLAEKQGGARFMVKIDAETRPVRIDREQVIDGLLKAMGIEREAYGGKLPRHVERLLKALDEDLAGSSAFEFIVGGQPPAGRNVVAVLKGGKPAWYEVGDPILFRAFTALDRSPPHWLTKWLAVPKRIGQVTITLTPDFMVANLTRDTLMGAVMSRAGFLPVVDSVRGMRMRITGDPIYRDFIANGGGLSSYLLDEKRLRHHLEKFYTSRGIDYRTVLDAPDKLLYGIETIADAFEMSTRLGEYKRAIERGENPRHAAYLAREVSTDFAMRGDSKVLGFFYDTVMFLRPAVESMDRIFRGVAHDPNRTAIATRSGMIALTSVGLYLLNRDNQEYRDLPDWDRDAHWHFFVPTPEGASVHLRYPKIWEIGALASAAERAVEKTIEENPAGLGKDMARLVKTTFGLNFMPQAIAPLYEQAANRNSFTGSRIETPGMENVQPFLRAKPSTSETLRELGLATRNLPEAVQVNPARTEALLRGYFNTWALYGLNLADAALYGDRLPEKRLDEYPVARRFYQGRPAIHTRQPEIVYEMLGEAHRLHGTMRALDRINRQDLADEKEGEDLARHARQLERANKRAQSIAAEMAAVRRSDATPTAKRQLIDALTVERNALLKATVEEVKSK